MSLDALYGFADEQAAKVHETYDFWPCKAGCDVLDGKNCCHHSLFPVSATEWHRLFGVLSLRPRKERREVRRAAQAIYDRYGLSGGNAFEEHHAADAPCPLLRGSSCSVYRDRPVICRAYGYFLDAESGKGQWCRKVNEVVAERGVKRVPSWTALAQRMSLSGPVKPLAAWIVESKL